MLLTPVQWPQNKGFSFSCWLRIENFPRNGAMGLFSFLTENGRGSLAVLTREKLTYEVRKIIFQISVFFYFYVLHLLGLSFTASPLFLLPVN